MSLGSPYLLSFLEYWFSVYVMVNLLTIKPCIILDMNFIHKFLISFFLFHSWLIASFIFSILLLMVFWKVELFIILCSKYFCWSRFLTERIIPIIDPWKIKKQKDTNQNECNINFMNVIHLYFDSTKLKKVQSMNAAI